MIDNPAFIKNGDPDDALGVAVDQPDQLLHKFELASLATPTSVVYGGMGGSALGISYIPSWLDLKVPLEVVRNYDIPKYVNQDTLVVVSSYSGNTEEALSMFNQALESGAQLVVIAGGGKLVEEAQAKNVPCLILPKVPQPRYSVLFSLKAVASVFVAAGLADANCLEELEAANPRLKENIKELSPDSPSESNPAKQLAKEIAGKTPVIYGSPITAEVAYKWKISFNENAKNVAWMGQYPEFNHNEFMGWTSHPVDKPYEVIDLRSSYDNPRIRQRFELSDRLLSGMRPKAHVIEAKGETKIEQLVYLTLFGDFTTLYLALINGVNPTPVALIEKFKVMLNQDS